MNQRTQRTLGAGEFGYQWDGGWYTKEHQMTDPIDLDQLRYNATSLDIGGNRMYMDEHFAWEIADAILNAPATLTVTYDDRAHMDLTLSGAPEPGTYALVRVTDRPQSAANATESQQRSI